MTMQKVEIVLLSIIGLLAVATGKPADGLGFLSFKDGGVRVNFGPWSAHAGLGGLLTGDYTNGGLHAGASGPSGIGARAGLGGSVGGGRTAGGLYADAGLGELGPKAAAGIGGGLTNHGSAGGSFAAATTGGGGPAVVKSVESQSFGSVQPSFVGKTVEKNVYLSGPTVEVVKTNVPSVSSKTVEAEVRQSVPNNIVKTVQRETLVPAQPNLVSYEHVQKVKVHGTPKKQKTRVSTVIKSRVSPSIQSGVVVEKAVYPAAANWNVQKYVETQAIPFEQIQYSNPAPLAASASAGVSGSAGFSGGAYGAGFGSGYGSGYGNSYYVKQQPSPQLFDDIFNIPISTLTAVNQLLRNKGK